MPNARVVSRLKELVVPAGRAPRRIRAGIFRNLWMELDLRDQTQMLLGLYERETQRSIAAMADGIRTAVDVGAGEGELALFFLARTAATRVVVVEPDGDRRDLLGRNLTLNGIVADARLSIRAEAIGSGANGEVTLDEILDGADDPILVKIDIDGGEAEALRGAGDTLHRDVRWLIETHSPELEWTCLSTLQEAGFAPIVVRNAWWRAVLPEKRPIPHNRWIVARR